MRNDLIAKSDIQSAAFDNDYTGQGKTFVKMKVKDGNYVAKIYERNNAVSIFFEECFRHVANKISGEERRFTLREFVASRYSMSPDDVDKEAVVQNVQIVRSGQFDVSLTDVIQNRVQGENSATLHQDTAGFKRSLLAISIGKQVSDLLSLANNRYAESLSRQLTVFGSDAAPRDTQFNQESVKPSSPLQSPAQLNLFLNGLNAGFDGPGAGFGTWVLADTEKIMQAPKNDLLMAAGLASGIVGLAEDKAYEDIFPEDFVVNMGQVYTNLAHEIDRRAIFDGLKSVEDFFSGLKDGLPSESSFAFAPSAFDEVKAFFGDAGDVRDLVGKIVQNQGVINGSNIRLVVDAFDALIAASDEHLVPARLPPCPVLGKIYQKAAEFLAATSDTELSGELPPLPQSLQRKFRLRETADGKQRQEQADLDYENRLRDDLAMRKKAAFAGDIEAVSLTAHNEATALNMAIDQLVQGLNSSAKSLQNFSVNGDSLVLPDHVYQQESQRFTTISLLVARVRDLFSNKTRTNLPSDGELAELKSTLAEIERLNHDSWNPDLRWKQEASVDRFVSLVSSLLPPV